MAPSWRTIAYNKITVLPARAPEVDLKLLFVAPTGPGRAALRAKINTQNLTIGLDRKLKYKLKFWSVLGRFPAKLGPRTPPDGSGSKNGAERTHN